MTKYPIITPANAADVLATLRWREDSQVINDFDEHVWLGPLWVNADFSLAEPNAPGARRIGITDCCFVASPCARHADFQPAAPQDAGGETSR